VWWARSAQLDRVAWMRFPKIMFAFLLVFFAGVQPVAADEIEGAWATDEEHCAKVFENRNGRTVLAQDSDLYGGGFVIDGNRITGKMATCTIKNRKQDGDTIHLVAACATDIMFSSVPFSLRLGNGQLTRLFPGMDNIQITYRRCRL
jgi:hypothetical protein